MKFLGKLNLKFVLAGVCACFFICCSNCSFAMDGESGKTGALPVTQNKADDQSGEVLANLANNNDNVSSTNDVKTDEKSEIEAKTDVEKESKPIKKRSVLLEAYRKFKADRLAREAAMSKTEKFGGCVNNRDNAGSSVVKNEKTAVAGDSESKVTESNGELNNAKIYPTFDIISSEIDVAGSSVVKNEKTAVAGDSESKVTESNGELNNARIDSTFGVGSGLKTEKEVGSEGESGFEGEIRVDDDDDEDFRKNMGRFIKNPLKYEFLKKLSRCFSDFFGNKSLMEELNRCGNVFLSQRAGKNVPGVLEYFVTPDVEKRLFRNGHYLDEVFVEIVDKNEESVFYSGKSPLLDAKFSDYVLVCAIDWLHNYLNKFFDEKEGGYGDEDYIVISNFLAEYVGCYGLSKVYPNLIRIVVDRHALSAGKSYKIKIYSDASKKDEILTNEFTYGSFHTGSVRGNMDQYFNSDEGRCLLKKENIVRERLDDLFNVAELSRGKIKKLFFDNENFDFLNKLLPILDYIYQNTAYAYLANQDNNIFSSEKEVGFGTGGVEQFLNKNDLLKLSKNVESLKDVAVRICDRNGTTLLRGEFPLKNIDAAETKGFKTAINDALIRYVLAQHYDWLPEEIYKESRICDWFVEVRDFLDKKSVDFLKKLYQKEVVFDFDKTGSWPLSDYHLYTLRVYGNGSEEKSSLKHRFIFKNKGYSDVSRVLRGFCELPLSKETIERFDKELKMRK